MFPRESEVLALIVQGRSNQQIADGTSSSVNSVKTYIRSAYRKIGVSHRAQARGVGHAKRLSPTGALTAHPGRKGALV